MTTTHADTPSLADDLATRSDDELYDILTHIDRQQAPQRYAAVRDEFARRHGPTLKGQPLDAYFDQARRNRPLAERSTLKRKILIGFAIWGLAMLIVRAVLYLRSAR